MLASQRSLERMIVNRLRRWGLKPLRRDGKVFICNPKRIQLNFADFFATFDYDEELCIADAEGPLSAVLWNRIHRHTNPIQPWLNYVEEQQAEAKYNRDQAVGAFDEMVKDVSKLQVQV